MRRCQNMPFPNLRRRIVRRLDEGDRGDRGWFLITRVHLSTARLRAVAEYLHDLGAADSVALGARHYAELALLCGVAGNDPGITLRRHHLLAMETPLNLLRRTDGNSWREVSLTQLAWPSRLRRTVIGFLKMRSAESSSAENRITRRQGSRSTKILTCAPIGPLFGSCKHAKGGSTVMSTTCFSLALDIARRRIGPYKAFGSFGR
jgi:hypothetical protein